MVQISLIINNKEIFFDVDENQADDLRKSWYYIIYFRYPLS